MTNSSSSQSDTIHNPQFRRSWTRTIPLSDVERRLNELRAQYGNIEGREIYLAERRAQLGWRQ